MMVEPRSVTIIKGDKMKKLNPGDIMLIVLQLLLTILVIGHWFKGYDIVPTLALWCIALGMSISPILEIIYSFKKDDDVFDEEFHKRLNKVLDEEDERALKTNKAKGII